LPNHDIETEKAGLECPIRIRTIAVITTVEQIGARHFGAITLHKAGLAQGKFGARWEFYIPMLLSNFPTSI